MRRDTVKAYRARGKATHDAIDGELARQVQVAADSYRQVKEKERADRATEGSITADTFVGLDLGAVFIRDQFGWRRVLKVNSRSVTVPSLLQPGWSDTVRFERIRQVRS